MYTGERGGVSHQGKESPNKGPLNSVPQQIKNRCVIQEGHWISKRKGKTYSTPVVSNN